MGLVRGTATTGPSRIAKLEQRIRPAQAVQTRLGVGAQPSICIRLQVSAAKLPSGCLTLN